MMVVNLFFFSAASFCISSKLFTIKNLVVLWHCDKLWMVVSTYISTSRRQMRQIVEVDVILHQRLVLYYIDVIVHECDIT